MPALLFERGNVTKIIAYAAAKTREFHVCRSDTSATPGSQSCRSDANQRRCLFVGKEKVVVSCCVHGKEYRPGHAYPNIS